MEVGWIFSQPSLERHRLSSGTGSSLPVTGVGNTCPLLMKRNRYDNKETPNPVQQSVSLTIRLCVCSRLWVIFIGCSHFSRAPANVIQGGAPGTLTRGGEQPSGLLFLESILGLDAPADRLQGALDQSEGNTPGSRVHGAVDVVPSTWPLLPWVT